jgi:transcriptional regulator of acetoin/glycerol metabolism
MNLSISEETLGEDEALAARHAVALLISGGAAQSIEHLARRIHAAQFGHAAPFVAVNASIFPCPAGRLQRYLTERIRRAHRGSLFLRDVERMPIRAQDAFGAVLARGMPPTVRLISGTTVSLVDRVRAGHFAEELFYRLNVIHVMTD